MNVVILGAGNVGFHLARYLIEMGNDVTLIEKDPEKARHASNLLDCLVINDTGNNIETLVKAGIRTADYFISVTESDEMNMVACGIVNSEFDVPHKIARIRSTDYPNTRVLQRPFLGIDFFVNPEIETSESIIKAVESGAVSDIFSFEKSSLQMRSMTVRGSSQFKDKSIGDLRKTIKTDFLVAVIFRDNDYIIPDGYSVVREDDKLYLIATADNFEYIFSQLGKEKVELNKVVLIGAERMSLYLLEHFYDTLNRNLTLGGRIRRYLLPSTRRRVNVFDSNSENCQMISERFPQAMVYETDISDEQFSEEEQLSEADVVIAATSKQELNIVNAIYAKSVGAKRTIALVNKSSYVHIASNLGIDVALSPVESMVNSILRYIRKSTTHSVFSISGGRVEVLELPVAETSRLANVKIRDLRLPKHTLILSVTRGEDHIIPDGELTLRSGDYVIVIIHKEDATRIEKIFTG